MDRFVVRAPTWKTLEMSSFSRSFANVSLTGKKSTPKEDKTKLQSTKRLSIRDESLMKIFTSQPDEPLIVDRSDNLSPVLLRYNGSFAANGPVSNEKNLQQSLRLASNDENTPPPNARITSNNEPVTSVMCSSEDSNSRPSTPISNMIPTNFGSCTPKDHPFLLRIQKDLNSPSAATRVRALKALRSPTKSTYANFDIPYEEQDIITEEERKSPVKVKSIQELMKDVVVYVEVRTGEDNRSSGIKKVISALGAKVNDKLLRDTTHVVFKDGLLSTYNKAKKWNIPIVSILWIEACKKQMKLMSPNDYPISNADRYENPELYDKMKRYKSMQPDAEENRRQRAKVPSKENGLKSKPIPATPTNSTKKKTDISSFFTPMDKLKSTPSNSCTTDTPVKKVERINDNFSDSKKSSDSLLKLAHLDSLSTLSDTVDSISKPNNAKNVPDFENNEITTKLSATPRTHGHRRNSIQVTQSPQKSGSNLVNSDNSVPETPSSRNRRRTSTHIPTNIIAPEKDGDKLQKVLYSTIVEEVTENSDEIVAKRQTTFVEESMNITKGTPLNKAQSSRRRTLYTPKAMEETTLRSTKDTPGNRRRTVFIPSSSKLSDSSNMDLCGVSALTPINSRIPSSTLIDEECVKTPLQLGSLLEEHATATFFNSAKPATNPRRRTLFDVSMDIIGQRLQNINQSAKSVRHARPEDPTPDRRSSHDDPETIAALLTPTESKNTTIRKELFAATGESATTPQAAAATSAAGEATIKKKRKLFVPNDILLTPTSQPATTELDDATTKKPRQPMDIATPANSTKRRKTIMPTLTQPRSEQKKPAPRTNGSAASHSSRRSTMDFEMIKKAKSLIKKPAASSAPAGETNNNDKPKPYPFLVYTNMHTEQIEFIKEAISTIQGFQLEDNVSDNTTHIVSLEPRRTINLLRGMVRGLWIVNYNWVVDSVKAGRWLYEEQYEMREFSRAVEICRSERQAFGNGYRMDIFSDLGRIYISSKCSIPSNKLKELVTLCAGRMADRRSRAKYIVGDSSQEAILSGKIYVEPQWILDSITHKQIQNPAKYSSCLALADKVESEVKP